MVFFYGFDYLEAIRSFEAASTLDNDCSRCQFALALSLGSITNAFTKGDELARASAILEKTHSKDLLTQGLLNALKLRYLQVKNPTPKPAPKNEHLCAMDEIQLPTKNKLAFSNALFQLMQQFPEDQTLATLFAYSVLALESFEFYDAYLKPKPYTLLMLEACRTVLQKNPAHIGAIHYLIHATEWSKDPKQSLPYAERLESLAPLAEHLVHMPTHVYLRIGDYNKAVSQNLRAVQVFDKYKAICREQGQKPLVNFLNQHNLDFLFTSSIFAGRSDVAIHAANQIREITDLSQRNKSGYLQRYYALKYFAIAHFGLWDQLKPLEQSTDKYPYLRAIWAYAKALEAIHKKPKDFPFFYQEFLRASEENNALKAFKEYYGNNLKIAKEVLQAFEARQKGQKEEAIQHWYAAATLEKAGGDPPVWYSPTSLGLGFALLDAGKPQLAIAAFESVLETYPDFGWSLYGLSIAHAALGNKEKSQVFEQRFKRVWDPKSVSLPIQQGSDLFF